jgi:hypothetical protein
MQNKRIVVIREKPLQHMGITLYGAYAKFDLSRCRACYLETKVKPWLP